MKLVVFYVSNYILFSTNQGQVITYYTINTLKAVIYCFCKDKENHLMCCYSLS